MEHSKLSTSYALPPGASFTCPPCSVRQKSSAQSTVQRLTYASTVNPRRQIYCFWDTTTTETTPDSSSPQPRASGSVFIHGIEAAEGDVAFLDVLPPGSNDEKDIASDLLLVHHDGEARCLSGDLKIERWRCPKRTTLAVHGSSAPTLDAKVEFATTADIATSRAGLLQGRGDALTLLESQSDDDKTAFEQTRLLILLSRSTSSTALESHGLILHVLVVGPGTASHVPGNHPPIRSLCQFHLPETGMESAGISKVSLHVGSGTLQFLLQGSLFTYDLAGTYPKLMSRLEGADGSITSFLRLSQASVLAATQTSLAVHDVFYCTVRCVEPIKTPALGSVSSSKRKRSDDLKASHPSPIDLLTFQTRLGLVVGRIDGQLVGCNVAFSRSEQGPAKRARAGTLLEALGQGTSAAGDDIVPLSREHIPSSLGGLLPGLGVLDSAWQKTKKMLDRYTRQKDHVQFERMVAEELGISRDEKALVHWRTQKKAWEKAHSPAKVEQVNGVGTINGTHVSKDSEARSRTSTPPFPQVQPIPTWKWPRQTDGMVRPGTAGSMDRSKVLFLISKIFAYCPQEQVRRGHGAEGDGLVEPVLQIVFCPPNVFQWLIWSGNLTLRNVELALRDTGARPSQSAPMHPESLVRAIMTYDPSTDLLVSVFEGPVYIDALEILRAVKPLIQSLAEPVPITSRALGGPRAEASQPNGPRSTVSPNEKPIASQDVQVLEPGTDRRLVLEKALTSALIRLQAFPCLKVSQAFGQALTRAELTLVIQLLRRNLTAGGWTSWQLDDDAGLIEDPRREHRDVCLISDLLGCALDSIGAAGWLHAPSHFGGVIDPSNLITALKLEISAALEVVEEAMYMKGLVKEMLQYGKSGTAAAKKSSKPQPRDDIIVLHPDPSGPKVLPLGSRPEVEVPLTKVGAGGEGCERTRRDVARLKNMKVGRYTLERIVI